MVGVPNQLTLFPLPLSAVCLCLQTGKKPAKKVETGTKASNGDEWLVGTHATPKKAATPKK